MSRNPAPELIHPEIWDQAFPAIVACRAKVRNHLEAGGWCLDTPSRKMRRVGEWDWPHIYRYDRGGPPDRPSLFKGLGESAARIPQSDVPELQQFVEYCHTRTDLEGTLLLPSDSQEPQARALLEHVPDLHIYALVLDVMDRCENVAAETEEEIKAIYAQREKSLFQEELPAEIVVPIAMGAFELEDPLQLDEWVRIEPMDEPTQLARVLEFNRSVSVGAAHSATHALVISGVVVNNNRPWLRWIDQNSLVPQHQKQIDRAFQALRVFVRPPIGYAQVLLRPLGWAGHWNGDLPPLSELAEVRAYPSFFDDNYWAREKSPIDCSMLDGLPDLFLSLSRDLKVFNLAVRRLDMACQRTDEDDKVLDCAIGLEALLGDQNTKTEITHRIALRGATLLSPEMDPEKIHKAIRYIYDRRSAIVHGSGKDAKPIPIDGLSLTPAQLAAFVLRECIKAAAEHGGKIDGKALDSRLLQALVPES